MLVANLLGQFLVTIQGERVEISSRPAQALLAYLLLKAGIPQRRESLAGIFWPQSSGENARSNLRHALWRIRKAFAASQPSVTDVIQADNFTICFNADADYWLDTAVLENEEPARSSTESLLESVSVYFGELLPGFYDPWVLLERERLQAVFETKMEHLLLNLIAEQRWHDVLEYGERWIALGLTPEPAYCALMIAHSALGDTSKMAAVYQRCCSDMQRELRLEPSPQTKDLYQRLSSGALPEPESALTARMHPGDVSSTGQQPFIAEQETLRAEPSSTSNEALREKTQALELARARSRLRKVVSALSLSLLLAILAASLALQQAAHSRQLARENRARELAAVAVSQLPIDSERSLLLALAAIETLAGGEQPVPSQVLSALRQSLQSMRILLTLPGTGGVAFSPDGRLVATTDLDNRATIWNSRTGEKLISLVGHTDELLNVAFSPDGGRLITTSLDGQAKIWDVYTGQKLLSLKGHEAGVISARFNHDGTRVITTSYDGTARIWDAYGGENLLLLDDIGVATGAAFFPTDDRILLADREANTAVVWDISNDNPTLHLDGHQARVNDVAISPNGQQLATTSDDKTARIWDASSGESLYILPHKSAVFGVDFSPDGAYVATASQEGLIRIWGVANGREVLVLPAEKGRTTHVVFSPADNLLASGGSVTRVWDISPSGSHERLTIAAHNDLISAVTYDDQGRYLATASWDGAAKIWDAATGRMARQLTAHDGRVASAAFGPTGGRLATAGYDGTARVWDVASGSELLQLIPLSFRTSPGEEPEGRPLPWVLGVAFSPNGRYLATTSQGGAVKLWDVETGEERMALLGHHGTMFTLAFSPDGRQLATAGVDGTVHIWDTATGEQLLHLEGHGDWVTAVVYSPDGQRLATSSFDNSIRLWDSTTGEELLLLSGHTAAVWDVVYGPDGRYLYSTGFDQTVRQWDSLTGDEVFSFHCEDLGLNLALDPDGRYLAVGTTTGLVRVYILSIDELVEEARSRLTRSLTPAECRQFLHTPTCPP